METGGFHPNCSLFLPMNKLHLVSQLRELPPRSSWSGLKCVLIRSKQFVTTENCPRGEPQWRNFLRAMCVRDCPGYRTQPTVSGTIPRQADLNRINELSVYSCEPISTQHPPRFLLCFFGCEVTSLVRGNADSKQLYLQVPAFASLS